MKAITALLFVTALLFILLAALAIGYRNVTPNYTEFIVYYGFENGEGSANYTVKKWNKDVVEAVIQDIHQKDPNIKGAIIIKNIMVIRQYKKWR